MDFKKLIVRSAIWTVAVIGLGLVGVGYITSNPTRGMSTDARSKKLGEAVGVVAMIGNGLIWIPAAFQHGQKRRAKQRRLR